MTLHIATSWTVGPAVRRAMRLPVPFLSDCWLMGPCALDPEVHRQTRLDFWRDEPSERARTTSAFRKIQKALAANRPLVVWSSPKWNDRVAVWAFCAYRLRHRPTSPDLSLVVVGKIIPANPPLLFEDGYVVVAPRLSREAWKTAAVLSLSEVHEKADFWRTLAAPEPILSGKPLEETPSRHELFTMGMYQAGFFPRKSEHRLSLSTLDALLLSLVDETPGTPADIMFRSGEDGEIWKWMHLTGDVILFERLAQWAQYGALHAVPHTTPNGVQNALYTITDTGRAILRDGLTSIDQAPPLPIWGVTAYDPKNPWVVVEEAEGRPVLRLLGE